MRFATLRAIERMSATTAPPGVANPSKVNPKLAKLIASKIECFAADGAADEQLAGNELTANAFLAWPNIKNLSGVEIQSLPNLKAALDHPELDLSMPGR